MGMSVIQYRDHLAGGLENGKRGVARSGDLPQQSEEDRAGAGEKLTAVLPVVHQVQQVVEWKRLLVMTTNLRN
jgi:hypothetical protein